MAGTFTDGKEGSCLGYAAHDASGVLGPFRFTRQAVGATDVAFDIHFCGICHSDLHQATATCTRRAPPREEAPRPHTARARPHRLTAAGTRGRRCAQAKSEWGPTNYPCGACALAVRCLAPPEALRDLSLAQCPATSWWASSPRWAPT